MGLDSHADFDGTRKENFPSKESIGPELGHEEILYNRWPREALMLYLSAHAISTFKISIQPPIFEYSLITQIHKLPVLRNLHLIHLAKGRNKLL